MERSKHRQADEGYFRTKKSLNVRDDVSGNSGERPKHKTCSTYCSYLTVASVVPQLIQWCSGLRAFATVDVRAGRNSNMNHPPKRTRSEAKRTPHQPSILVATKYSFDDIGGSNWVPKTTSVATT